MASGALAAAAAAQLQEHVDRGRNPTHATMLHSQCSETAQVRTAAGATQPDPMQPAGAAQMNRPVDEARGCTWRDGVVAARAGAAQVDRARVALGTKRLALPGDGGAVENHDRCLLWAVKVAKDLLLLAGGDARACDHPAVPASVHVAEHRI